MSAKGLEACLLFNEPNIRYATGASAMPVYAMSTFVRCALVPVRGRPILFEHSNSIHRSAVVTDAELRPMHAWEFFDDAAGQAEVFAREIIEGLSDLGVTSRTLAVDRLGTPGYLALRDAGLEIVDSSPATQAAREVKTVEEVALMRLNGTIVHEMLSGLRAAIAPGRSERELLAILAAEMLRRGGEYLATNTLCSGPNTNPWRAEATERALEAGDLVYVDTDTVGIEGYFFCVSRTFLCGEMATPAQKDAYRVAYEWLEGMKELIRPGLTCGEIATKAPPIPDRYLAQRYECLVHGVGLEEESPSVCHPLDPQSNSDRVIENDMTLVVEIYAGEESGPDGVKLGDEILVTSGGCEVLAPFPYEAALL